MRALILALAFTATTAHAADFGVVPMRIELPAGQRHSDLRIHNFSEQPLRLSITGHGCADAEDKDCTGPADGLVFFPRNLEVAPKSSRIVRIGVRSSSPAERRFALRLQEVQLVAPQVEEGRAVVQLLLNVQVGVVVPPGKPGAK